MIRSAAHGQFGGSSSGGEIYSTLEVKPSAYSTLEVRGDNYRGHASDVLNQGYKALPGLPIVAEHDGLHVVGQQQSPSPSPEPGVTVTGGRIICGLRARTFWIVFAVVVVVVAGAVAGGTAAALVSRDNPKAVMAGTRLSSTYFDDGSGNDNYLLLYQLNNKAIYMSAFNSSTGAWVVSPVVDGTTEAGGGLEDVVKGTALSISRYGRTNSGDIHVYWQSTTGTVRSLVYSNLSTTEPAAPDGWTESQKRADFKTAGPGASIVSYGSTCYDCAPDIYYFCQLPTGRITGAWSSPKYRASDGDPEWNTVDFLNNVALPAMQTSMAVVSTPSLDFTGELSLFAQSEAGLLTHIAFDGESDYREYPLETNFSSVAAIAAVSHGFIDGDGDLALGIRVLTVEPSAPVYLTYFRDGAWDPAREVSEMSDCSSRASIATNDGFRVYCVVDGSRGGVEIAEWRGQSDPKGNASDFTNYERVGTVITSV
ncbi:putative fungal fucose-specific lectin protein [Rosellinia necatrix]|uniref:Putative fungal fucose-specific lectin protein n=1 Tax=Rosellinia necatrix TaxID=77044 RepID=A0A1W2TKJ6_ROSNE|nr:putative fungal fucose-specific lectin protein [Rosellinia necatrix]